MFVVPICGSFWLRTVSGAAVRGVLGEDRWPTERGYLDLAGEEVRFFTCSKYCIYSTVFPHRL